MRRFSSETPLSPEIEFQDSWHSIYDKFQSKLKKELAATLHHLGILIRAIAQKHEIEQPKISRIRDASSSDKGSEAQHLKRGLKQNVPTSSCQKGCEEILLCQDQSKTKMSYTEFQIRLDLGNYVAKLTIHRLSGGVRRAAPTENQRQFPPSIE